MKLGTPRKPQPTRLSAIALYAATIFLGSFLLFQIQPVIARFILPWFGGSPAVWTTCMVFFQALLILGYGYAHLLGNAAPKTQCIMHLGLLMISVVMLEIQPDGALKPTGTESPIASILFLLATHIGIPYLALSSTSPLLQHWFAQTHPGRSPYRLFVLSNLGSLLGLLTYPFLVEPLLTLRVQASAWQVGYVVYAVVCGICAVRYSRAGRTTASTQEQRSSTALPRSPQRPTWQQKLLWLGLATAPSIMLLAVTNQISQDIAVVPFLWILPLSLYLISFIICFDREAWYKRQFWVSLALFGIAAVVGLLHYLLEQDPGMLAQISIYSFCLFSCCMVCHGELVRIKPAPHYLTGFYLTVAVGGACGGVFVSLIAPHIFQGLWELHTGLILAFLLVGICLVRTKARPRRIAWQIAWGLAAILLTAVLFQHARDVHFNPLASSRNFYGVLRIYEEDFGPLDSMAAHDSGTRVHGTNPIRSMYYGEIMHGNQFTAGQLSKTPISYYARNSGIDLALRFHPHRQQRATGRTTNNASGLHVGVIGLGTGTIAAHGRPGDVIRFYEINTDVIQLNKKYFTYLSDSPAEISVIIGDARIQLEQELIKSGPHQFDLLVLDAFTGGAVPIHLLTREAFGLYLKHLKPNGILALHITNRYLDLSPVVKGLAIEFQQTPLLITSPQDLGQAREESDWVLLTDNPTLLHDRRITLRSSPAHWEGQKSILWTDDFSNLFQVLR